MMLRLFLVALAVAIPAARGDGGDDHVHYLVVTCGEITCDVKGSICKDGTCQCPDGYLEDCGVCEDIDECATQADDCNFKLGQECKNTNGSFECPCREGLEDTTDSHCEDIDECQDDTHKCGANAQCNNLWAGAACECCAGYKVDPNDDKACVRDPAQALPASGQCCACQGSLCNRDGEVCGSDGVSYGSYRAMAQASCGAAAVNYPGPCQDACANVECAAEHSWCTENKQTGEPQCNCPTCEGGPEQTGDKQVCGTDGVTYVSICHLQKAACEDPMYKNIEVRFEGQPCPEPQVGRGGGGGGGSIPDYPKPGPWSPWSECSEKCKQGEQTRTRDAKGLGPNSQTRQCYRSCNEGPCHPTLCHAPHAICIADANNNTACACPVCLDDEDTPVCARVGNYIKTFDSECAMKQAACEQHEERAEVLESNACEAKPEGCGKVRHFETYEDVEGCRADRALDVGLCYGGCDTGTGKNASNCCTATKIEYGVVILSCPDGSRKNKHIKQVKECGCMEVDDEELQPWVDIQPKLNDMKVDDVCANGDIKTIEIKNNMPKYGEKLQALVEVSPNAQAEDIIEVKTRPDHDSFILKPSTVDLDETPTMPGEMEMAIFTTVFKPTSEDIPADIMSMLPNLKNPNVFTYMSNDGTLKVLTSFVSEEGKDYDSILPKFAELFDVAPYMSVDDIPEQDVPVILLAKPHSTTTVTKCVPKPATEMPQM